MSVQMRTILDVADNSGARKLQVILPLGGGLGKKAGLGDVVTAAVKEASPDGTVKKGKVVKAVIVRTRKEYRRKDGTYIRFDQNAAVVIRSGPASSAPWPANSARRSFSRSSRSRPRSSSFTPSVRGGAQQR
jgi:large subunit ribosomal protein L14